MRGDIYQMILVAAGVVTTVLFGAFLYREIFPEYKIYQEDYVALEKFRSSYTGESPPQFSMGVKQIVFERADKGPPLIDRCTSCHVALDIPYFSPTKIARDINGNIELDPEGRPVQIPNPDFIWTKLDQEIAKLTDSAVLEQLKKEGNTREVQNRLNKAEEYKALKVAHVGDQVFDVTKVLRMHPLMGRETRPFEYHPTQQFGCTSCHSGNGRGLTTDKAHGPVFDGRYETEFEGPVPKFTEPDPLNDPSFAFQFNDKPGSELIFQTTPLFVGPLMQARCVNCHQDSASALKSAAGTASNVADQRQRMSKAIEISLINEKEALLSLLEIYVSIQNNGLPKTIEQVKARGNDFSLPEKERHHADAQLAYLSKGGKEGSGILTKINANLLSILGSKELVKEIIQKSSKEAITEEMVNQFLMEHRDDKTNGGSIFVKEDLMQTDQDLLRHAIDTQTSFQKTVSDQKVVNAMVSDIDLLTKNYQRGEQLYISQACYACHRIAGLARGGVGPELTTEGFNYPWFIKKKLVWPQGDLPTSTMPNYRMDHVELQDLMTFLLGQIGNRKATSETAYKVAVQEWEAGKKMPWEQEISPAKVHDLNYSMTVFATEGCAACHRLKGFESNVGYAVEKQQKPSWDDVYKESVWFKGLVPETISGSELVKVLDDHQKDFDSRIVDGVREGSLIEKIDEIIPGQVESFYTSFKYASRAKNYHYKELIENEKDPTKKETLSKELDFYKARVHRALMMFIQEYGFGRLIGPRPNWSGVYRSDEWLMEHFHNPAAHVPHSIMPVFPFDDSKFYALTHMLDVLGRKNRDQVREIWEHRGFNPEQAYFIHCSQCHGDYLQGNGPVSEWIYPIPKNLRNADFLRNYTEERVVFSITHGVKGTPMPPWGEIGGNKKMMDNTPVLSKSEIKQLADWIFSSLPGGTVIKSSQDVPKWNYQPEDVVRELYEEGNQLK